jgi:hypothetical protein
MKKNVQEFQERKKPLLLKYLENLILKRKERLHQGLIIGIDRGEGKKIL